MASPSNPSFNNQDQLSEEKEQPQNADSIIINQSNNTAAALEEVDAATNEEMRERLLAAQSVAETNPANKAVNTVDRLMSQSDNVTLDHLDAEIVQEEVDAETEEQRMARLLAAKEADEEFDYYLRQHSNQSIIEPSSLDFDDQRTSNVSVASAIDLFTEEDGWKATRPPRGMIATKPPKNMNSEVTFTKESQDGSPPVKVEIFKDRVSITNNDESAFDLALEAFEQKFPGITPKITPANDEARAMWETVLADKFEATKDGRYKPENCLSPKANAAANEVDNEELIERPSSSNSI